MNAILVFFLHWRLFGLDLIARRVGETISVTSGFKYKIALKATLGYVQSGRQFLNNLGACDLSGYYAPLVLYNLVPFSGGRSAQ